MWGWTERETDLAALAAGDRREWSSFVAREGRTIRRAVARTFRRFGAAAREAEIDDAVQDVFLRLAAADFRLVRGFDPARAKLSTYLGVIAHSAAVDALRRLRPAVPIEFAPDAAAPEARSGAPVELPPGVLTDRQVAVMRLLCDHDLDVEEVARLLGISEQTVRSTRHKAAARLRAHLAAEG